MGARTCVFRSTCSVAHWPTHTLAHSLNYALTHSLAHSLVRSVCLSVSVCLSACLLVHLPVCLSLPACLPACSVLFSGSHADQAGDRNFTAALLARAFPRDIYGEVRRTVRPQGVESHVSVTRFDFPRLRLSGQVKSGQVRSDVWIGSMDG
jgi:hypothetical protein